MNLRPALALALLSAAPALYGAYGMRSEEVFIPMPDGVRLSATLYRPDGAKRGERFPVILEYLPYRKNDGTLAGDLALFPYMVNADHLPHRRATRAAGA